MLTPFSADGDAERLERLREEVDHVPFGSDSRFQDIFVANTAFPA